MGSAPPPNTHDYRRNAGRRGVPERARRSASGGPGSQAGPGSQGVPGGQSVSGESLDWGPRERVGGRHHTARSAWSLLSVLQLLMLSALLVGTASASTMQGCDTPRSATDYFDMFQDKNDWSWSGGAQAASYRASNGATYWMTADAVVGPQDAATGGYAKGWRLVGNSILVQRGCSVARATPTAVAIPDALNGDRFWAMGAVEHGGSLWVTAQRVRPVPGGFGLEPAGVEIAEFKFKGDELLLRSLTPTPSTGTRGDAVQYSGATVAANGYVYYYGYRHTGGTPAHTGYVARVAIGDLSRVGAWRFWTGSNWSTDLSKAKHVLDGQPTSAALIKGTWVVLYKDRGAAGSKVYALTAKAPTGPFDRRVLMNSPAGVTPSGTQYVTYSPQLHPEAHLSSGKTLVSICWNGRDLFADTSKDADLYKPRFTELALP